MAAIFDSAPAETYYPANQTLMYTLASDGGAIPSSHRLIVQVFEGTTNEIAKLYLTANPNDKAFFDLSAIIKDRLEVDVLQSDGTGTVFDMSSHIDVSTNATQRFKISIGTFNGTSESLAEADKFIYLVKGTEQISSGILPSFANYYPTAPTVKGWLTERFGNKTVVGANSGVKFTFATEDKGVLAWIHDSLQFTGVDTQISYQLYSTAGAIGSGETITISSSGGNALTSTDYAEKIHYFGFAPSSLQFTQTPVNNSNWNHYTFWLQNTGGTVRASKYISVFRDYGICKNNRVQIAFGNRVGGWEYLNFDGRPKKTETSEQKTYNVALGDYSGTTYSFDASARTTKPYQVTSKIAYSLNSINFKVEDNYLLEGLLRSDNIMMHIHDSSSQATYLPDRNKWLPVTLNTKSLQIRDADASEIVSVSIEVQLAQDIRC